MIQSNRVHDVELHVIGFICPVTNNEWLSRILYSYVRFLQIFTKQTTWLKYAIESQACSSFRTSNYLRTFAHRWCANTRTIMHCINLHCNGLSSPLHPSYSIIKTARPIILARSTFTCTSCAATAHIRLLTHQILLVATSQYKLSSYYSSTAKWSLSGWQRTAGGGFDFTSDTRTHTQPIAPSHEVMLKRLALLCSWQLLLMMLHCGTKASKFINVCPFISRWLCVYLRVIDTDPNRHNVNRKQQLSSTISVSAKYYTAV